MKKVLSLLLIFTFLSGNISFVFAKDTCKEEIIENASNPVFSPDGKSFAYEGIKDNKDYIVKTTCTGETKTISGTGSTLNINYTKQQILSKSKLNKTTKGKNYIKQVDSIVTGLDDTKLETLYTNLLKTEKPKKYTNLFDYLEASIGVKLGK